METPNTSLGFGNFKPADCQAAALLCPRGPPGGAPAAGPRGPHPAPGKGLSARKGEAGNARVNAQGIPRLGERRGTMPAPPYFNEGPGPFNCPLCKMATVTPTARTGRRPGARSARLSLLEPLPAAVVKNPTLSRVDFTSP